MIKGQFQICYSKKRELETEAEELEQTMHKGSIKIKELEELETELQVKAQERVKKRAVLSREVAKLNQMKLVEAEKLKRLEEETTQGVEDLKRHTENAMSCYERVEVRHSKAEIEKRIHLLRTKIKERGEDPNDPQEYYDRYQEKNAEVQRLEYDVKVNERVVKGMQNALELRNVLWLDFRTHIATRSNTHFCWFMNQRGYIGTLEYNFEKETLSVKVKELL